MNAPASFNPELHGTAPDRGSGKPLERLKGLLREMFQLDRGDLDFGLYRIMNLKAKEVAAFLDEDLLPQVRAELQLASDEERQRLEQEEREAIQKARELLLDPEDAPAIQQLRRRLAAVQKEAMAEADVYNHLANFFDRYFAEGDFIAQRRYSSGGRAAYLLPYAGEEVKLHWANADQHYVKTTENYAAYTFMAGGSGAERRVRFETVAADNERDNVKASRNQQRRFLLSDAPDSITVTARELIVRFEHRPLSGNERKDWPGNGKNQQIRINEASAAQISKALDAEWQNLLGAPALAEARGQRSLLAQHLETYTAKNSFDYFIHKDLGGFLRRELDLYLSTEILHLDDAEQGDAAHLARALARVRALRRVGAKIIDFLAQLEDFQKQLWLKKKFVLETQWCLTLDCIPEALYPVVGANAAQCEEWVALCAVDEIQGDLANGGVTYSHPLSADFLKAHPHLVVDTRHFSREFTDQVLAALSRAGGLDERKDGLLIQGDNFQALNLLAARYREQAECIYIDPPYNTAASEIIYKNGYKDSSWLSLMENRLQAGKRLLARRGIQCTTIDDAEFHRLRELLAQIYGESHMAGVAVIKHNPSGRSTVKGFSMAHEYAIFCLASDTTVLGALPRSERQLAQYPEEDAQGKFQWRSLLRSGGANDFRAERPRLHYPIAVDGPRIRLPAMQWNDTARQWELTEPAADREKMVWPVANGHEYTWRLSADSLRARFRDVRVRALRDGRLTLEIKFYLDDLGVLPKTVWDEKTMNATAYGTTALRHLMGTAQAFSFPKSIYAVEKCLRVCGLRGNGTVLDYFAGSGTTGHAVINLNREDEGRRKYILVEMGRHFDTVLMPRLKKVAYARDWREGKPVSRQGSTQVFQYIRLESYEDTLDSLEVRAPSEDQQRWLAENPAFAEDYRLRYALGAETSGSACLLGQSFADPFAYTLSVTRDGLRREITVDLPETFNYLVGLRVASRQRLEEVLAISGTDPQGRRCLILWRNLNAIGSAGLDAWFERHRPQFDAALRLIYVNGDHALNALKRPGDHWEAHTIEPVFRALMFKEI